MNKQEKLKLRRLYLLLWNKYHDNGYECVSEQIHIGLIENVKWGICFSIRELYELDIISSVEFVYLSTDFKSRKINIFSEHYWNKAYNKTQVGYWWKCNEEGYKARKNYIISIIKKLS
jgi:hypothetical protein